MLNQYFGWMGVQEAAMAMANYGCYVSTTEFGLKVIHWNSIVTGMSSFFTSKSQREA